MARLFLAAVVMLTAPEVVITSAAQCAGPPEMSTVNTALTGSKVRCRAASGAPNKCREADERTEKISKLMNSSDYLRARHGTSECIVAAGSGE